VLSCGHHPVEFDRKCDVWKRGCARRTTATVGHTDFTYTTNPVPAGGFYSVIKGNDAGHIYFGPFPITPPVGYTMIGSYSSLICPKLLFSDTVRNLCGSSRYLFWAGINNRLPSSCMMPNFTFSIETTSGAIIKTFETGNINGSPDNYSWYYGYYDRTKKPKVPFYGGSFQLPAGVKDIVVKIIPNPTGAACSADFEIDNIILMPVGPDIRISSLKYPGGWKTAACFQGVPLELTAKIESGYRDLGSPNYVLESYTNPGFQWQQSLDEGYTWTDLPGETAPTISHNFNIPDTFWVRVRVSEAGDISNPSCSNVSNIMQVEVDALPKDFSFNTNSPVCTDGELKLTPSGGASYQTYGPNGFFDSSPFPSIYHPKLRDSGWYFTEIATWGGCTARDSAYVKINGPDLSVSSGKTICYGDTVRLHATGGDSYSWTPDDDLRNQNTANPIASPLKSTTYQVKASDGLGCSAYANVTILLRDSILRAAMSGPDVLCPGDGALLKDSSMGAIKTWFWSFGNGNTSNAQNPPMQSYPSNNSFFSVNLTVVDTAGCEQTVKKIIRSVNNCFIAVPTAFTPNNDGLNDFLYPLNAYKARNLEFKVFDRWGKIVFEARDWTRKWDGNLNGEPQPTAVYVWILTYTDADNKHFFLKGTTALIR
jgi:gliding motility-associated-like protein